MTLRVAQVNCVLDEQDRDLPELLSAWPTVLLVAEAVASAGAEVTVLQSGHRPGQHRANGVNYEFVVEPRLRRRTGAGLAPWRLTAALRRLKPDVVHFNGLEHPLHLRAACAAGAPVLAQDHASSPNRRDRLQRRWSLRKVTACAFTSADQAAPFCRAGHFPPGLPVLEIPESSSVFKAGDQQAARDETGVFGDPALLWVGRLNEGKDPFTMLAAVRMALEQLPDLHLWCAFGEPDLLAPIEQLLCDDQRLADHVHLLGPVAHTRIETLCRACDLFVLSSRHESTGYALLEALACGLTPVVTDIPPFRNLTRSGAVGELVPPRAARGFADAIIRQARLPRAATRAATLAHFDKHLSPQALGQHLVSAYEKVIRGQL